MKVAFYAPLKPPDNPIPSGDRLMARLLIKALEAAGHEITLVSRFRSYLPSADFAPLHELQSQSRIEADRIAAQWNVSGSPDMWFTYHPYYKSPDLLGPKLCRTFAIPYATAEASYSARRNIGAWAYSQSRLVEGIGQAQVNFCFTARDQAGLAEIAPRARLARIAPFIDTTGFSARASSPHDNRLITVAMMRKGDKFASFQMLATALGLIEDLPWTLTVVGGGPLEDEVKAMFAGFPIDRIQWIGEASPEHVPRLLGEATIYVWPGCGEAYGLAYLEAQAAGLPVVAQNTAGVPEVVTHGETGLLTPEGDISAFADGIRFLLCNQTRREEMAMKARGSVLAEHSLARAAAVLRSLIGSVA